MSKRTTPNPFLTTILSTCVLSAGLVVMLCAMPSHGQNRSSSTTEAEEEDDKQKNTGASAVDGGIVDDDGDGGTVDDDGDGGESDEAVLQAVEREDAEDLLKNVPVLPPLRRIATQGVEGATIGGSKVIVDRPKPDEERQLGSYLLRYIGRPADEANLQSIETQLLNLERYRAAVCRYTGKGKARLVRCGVTRAPTIRSVTLEGLPLTLLETDIMRRVFLRPGEVLDEKDEKGQSRIARQEERLTRYLERKGLYGAVVRVLSPPVSKTSEIDVVIRISGGEFVSVRSVISNSPAPYTREEIVNIFSSMCLGDGLVEGFETLTLACFTQERTSAVTENLEADLRKRGYPEGRVRVMPKFVGLNDDGTIVSDLPIPIFPEPSDDDEGDGAPAEDDVDAGPTDANASDGGVDDDATEDDVDGGDSGPRRRRPRADRKRDGNDDGRGRVRPNALLRKARAALNVQGPEEKEAPPSAALPVSEKCRPLPGKRAKDPPTPRCVDLVIDVSAGPHLNATVDIVGGEQGLSLNPEPNGVRDFFRGLGRIAEGAAVVPSRILQLGVKRPLATAVDTNIDVDELQAALTFNDAHSADETEAWVSAQSLRFALQRRGYFFAGVAANVDVEDSTVNVRFEVDPGDPVAVRGVRFHGNETHPDKEILAAVTLASRARGPTTTGFVTELDLEQDRQRLVGFYEALGFVEVNVEVDAERVGADGIIVHFRIQEGPRWHIADLVFEGIPEGLVDEVVRALEHCKGGVATSENRPPIVPADCRGAPFRPSDEDALTLERQRVLNVFVSEGFPYASADIAPIDFNADGGVVLRIRVDPIGAVSDAARAKLEKRQREKEVKHAKAKAKDASGDSTSNAPDDESEENSPSDMVNLPSADDDDAIGRVRLGEIFIDGAHISDRNVMLRELAVTEDLVLRPRRIAEGVSRLRRTGLYSRVELDFLGIEEQADRVHLLIQVEERPTVTVDTSLGFSTDRLFGWRLEARDRNFYGSMFDVSGTLDFGLFIGRYTNAQAQVRWPRVLGSRVDIRVTPSFVYEDRPSADIPRVPKDPDAQLAVGVWSVDQFRRRQARIGQVLGLEVHPLENSDVLTLSIDFEQRLEWTDNLAKPITPFSLESLQTVDGMTLAFQQCVLPVSTVTPKVTLRDLDNPFDPKQGYRLEGSVMVGHPILGVSCSSSTFDLNRLELIGEWVGLVSASATGYYTFGRVTLAGNIRGWTGLARSDDRFFQSSLIRNQGLLAVGGDRSVRGFNQDDIGLKSYGSRPEEGIAVYDADNLLSLSGAVLNLELRTTLIPNFFVGDLNGAAFVDVGMVTDTINLPWLSPRQMWQQLSAANENYVDPRLGVGIGVGLRYVLPVGPISADFALRPDPVIDALFGFTPRNPAFDLHFQLGYVF